MSIIHGWCCRSTGVSDCTVSKCPDFRLQNSNGQWPQQIWRANLEENSFQMTGSILGLWIILISSTLRRCHHPQSQELWSHQNQRLVEDFYVDFSLFKYICPTFLGSTLGPRIFMSSAVKNIPCSWCAQGIALLHHSWKLSHLPFQDWDVSQWKWH